MHSWENGLHVSCHIDARHIPGLDVRSDNGANDHFCSGPMEELLCGHDARCGRSTRSTCGLISLGGRGLNEGACVCPKRILDEHEQDQHERRDDDHRLDRPACPVSRLSRPQGLGGRRVTTPPTRPGRHTPGWRTPRRLSALP